MARKRTQFVTEKKLAKKYLGPCQNVKIKHNDGYDVKKVAGFEGPRCAATYVDYMKSWKSFENDEEEILSSGTG